MDAVAMKVKDEVVADWNTSLQAMDLPRFRSLSEEEKVAHLTKVSIILSKLWVSESNLHDNYFIFILRVLESEWINPKLCTLCLFCVKWCKGIEISPMVITSLSTTLQFQLKYLRSAWERSLPLSEDTDLKLLDITTDVCQILVTYITTNSTSENECFLQLLQHYLQFLHSIVSVVSSLPMKKLKKLDNVQMKFLQSLNIHSDSWSKLLSSLHVSLLVRLLPSAFEYISLLNQIISSKKIFSQEVSNAIFYYWRFMHVIFSCLSTQDNAIDNNSATMGVCLKIEVSVTSSLIDKITFDPNNLEIIEKNKELFMNLVAPNDAVGLLTFPLTKLLKYSRWLTCISYSELISTMLRFPRWYQPQHMLKLCLRFLHHFLILPHMNNNIENNSNSTNNSDISKSHSIWLETRIMQQSFLRLLLSLPMGDIGWQILRTVGVSVPTVPRITIADIIEQTSQAESNVSQGIVFVERQLFLLYCRFIQCIRRCEEPDYQLFNSTSLAAHSTTETVSKHDITHFHANRVSSIDSIRDFYMSNSFRYLPNDQNDCINSRTMQYLTYREQLRNGLFSFRSIFQRSDILSTSHRDRNDRQDNTNTFETRLADLNDIYCLCEQWIARLSLRRTNTCSSNTDYPTLSNRQWTEAMEALGGLWTMQVYMMTKELFRELSRAASVSPNLPANPKNNSISNHINNNNNIPSSVSAFSSPVEFKAYYSQEQNPAHMIDGNSQGTQQQQFNFSQSWYQTTQLDTFFTHNATVNLASTASFSQSMQYNNDRNNSSYLRISRVLKGEQQQVGNPSNNLDSTESNTNSTNNNINLKKNSEEEKRFEQLVLAASHPLAIHATHCILTFVAKFAQLFVSIYRDMDEKEQSNSDDDSYSIKSKLQICVEELLEPVIESLWWFFHRTSGFALDLQEIKAVRSWSKLEKYKNNEDTNVDDEPNLFMDGKDIMKGIVASLNSMRRFQSIVPWEKLFRLQEIDVNMDQTAMDCVLGATWIYHMLFSATKASSVSDEVSKTGQLSSPSLSITTSRISMALQKSMNSLTDAGLLPSVFSTLSQLLRYCLLAYNHSDHKPQDSLQKIAFLDVGKNVCDFIVPCASETESSGLSDETLKWSLTFHFPASNNLTTLTSRHSDMKSSFLHEYAYLFGKHIGDFVRFAICKMSSMVANTAEQYTPDLLTNMTSGLRDIFTCVFLLHQFDAIAVKEHSINTKEEEITWIATETLFKLWLLLENLLYRYQYTILFQQLPANFVKAPSTLDAAKLKHLSVEQVFDAQYLWPSMYFWVTSHHITMNNSGGSNTNIVTTIVRIYRMLKLYYLVRHQEAQDSSACRLALPLSQHYLSSICSMCLCMWLTEGCPDINNDNNEDMVMSCLWDTVAAVVSIPQSLCPEHETFHVPCHHQVFCHFPSDFNSFCVETDASVTWHWNHLCQMSVTVAVSRALNGCYIQAISISRDGKSTTSDEETKDKSEQLWREINDMFVAVNVSKPSDGHFDTNLSLFGRLSLTQIIEFLEKSFADFQLHSFKTMDSTVLRRKAEEQLLVIHQFYDSSRNTHGKNGPQHDSTDDISKTISDSSRYRFMVSQDIQKLLCEAVYIILVYVAVMYENLNKSKYASQLLHCDKKGAAVTESNRLVSTSIALSSSPLIVSSPESNEDKKCNSDINVDHEATDAILQLPSLMDVAQETFYSIEPSNNPIFSPQHPVQTNDKEVSPEDKKNHREEDDDDIERTTDVVEAKHMRKPVDHHRNVDNNNPSMGNSGFLMIGERLIFTDDDVCMTGLSGGNMGVGNLNKNVLETGQNYLNQGEFSIRESEATLTNDDTQQQQERSHIDDDEKVHDARLLTNKRKRDEVARKEKDEDETYLTGAAPQGQHMDEVSTVQEKRRKIQNSNILRDLPVRGSLWSTAEQTLATLQTKWSKLVAANPQSSGAMEIAHLQSLHELLQESHVLSQTLHALTVQQMLSVTSQNDHK